MSANPHWAQARNLMQQEHYSQALDLLRGVEAVGGPSPELEFDKGVCLAELGRITEARIIARMLKNEGQVALAHDLLNRIPTEDAGGVDLGEEIVEPFVRSHPVSPPQRSGFLTYAIVAASAVVILATGLLLGAQITKRHESSGQSTAPAATAPRPETTQETAASMQPAFGDELAGQWQCVDLVRDVEQFRPGERLFTGTIGLNWVVCYANGTTTMASTWKDGWATDTQTKTRVEFKKKQFGGDVFLFLPLTAQDPGGGTIGQHYVLKKVSRSTAGTPPPTGLMTQAATAQPGAVQWQQGSLDLTGTWQSVDFVREPTQFVPGKKFWRDSLLLTTLVCYSDGSSTTRTTWGNGMVRDLDSGYQAAYDVKTYGGRSFLFFPWINGDVVQRGENLSYYVLTRN